MEKMILISGLSLLSLFPLKAQDAVESAVPLDGRDASIAIENELYFSAPIQTGKKSFVSTLFHSSGTQLVSVTFMDRKLTRRHGTVVGYNNNGDTQFVSNYQRNRLNGEWNSWFDNRNRCDSGRMVNNVPDGEWKGWYPDGNQRYVYHFDARKLASLQDELRRQPKTKFFALAQKPINWAIQHMDASFIFGKSTAKRKSLFPNRQLNKRGYDELALKSIIDQNTSASISGEYSPPFAECLLHGKFTSYYPNGRIKETGYYRNGLREGLWEELSDKEDIKAVGTYYHGQKKGEWRYYTTRGKLLEMRQFDNGGVETMQYQFRSK